MVQQAIPVISSIEFVLGFLWARPASREELLEASLRVPSPTLDPEDVDAVLRGLEVQGLVSRRGERLVLARDKLHPTVKRAAQLVARDLEILGVV